MSTGETSELFLQVDAPTEVLRKQMDEGARALTGFESEASRVLESFGRKIAKAGDQFGPFQQKGKTALRQLSDEFESGLKKIEKLAGNAITLPAITAAGGGSGLNLGAAEAKEAALQARVYAQNMALLEAEVNRVALAEGNATSAYGINLQAARTATTAAEEHARVLAREAGQLEQLEINLRTSGTAVAAHTVQQGNLKTVSGSTRAGMQQLSYQLSDVATQFTAGTPPMIIFAQQSGQVVQAIQLMTNESKGFIGFLGGPWGLVITAAITLLAPFAAKLFDAKKATNEHTAAAVTNKSAIEQLNAILANDPSAAVAKDARKLAEARIAQANATFTAARAEAALRLAQGQSRLTDLEDGSIKGNLRGGGSVTYANRELAIQRGIARNQVSSAQAELDALEKSYSAARSRIIAARDVSLSSGKSGSSARTPSSGGGDGSGRGNVEAAAKQAEDARLRAMIDPLRAPSAEFAQAQAKTMAGTTETEWTAMLDAINTKRETMFGERQEELRRLQDQEAAQIDLLSNLFESGFRGGVSAIWDDFKNIGSRVISQVLARFVLAQATGKGGGFSLSGVFNTALHSVLGFKSGGRIDGFAGGGMIKGAGTGTSDSILAMVGGSKPIMVSNGEGIMNAQAVADFWPLLDAMNKGQVPKFAAGGLVAPRLPQMRSASFGGRTVYEQHFHVNAQGAVLANDLVTEMQRVGIRATIGGADLAQQRMSDQSMASLA